MQGFPGAPSFLQQPPQPAPTVGQPSAPAWQPPPQGAQVPSPTPGYTPPQAPADPGQVQWGQPPQQQYAPPPPATAPQWQQPPIPAGPPPGYAPQQPPPQQYAQPVNPYAPPPAPPPAQPSYPQGMVPQGAPPGFTAPAQYAPPQPVPQGYGAPAQGALYGGPAAAPQGMGMQAPWAGMSTAQLSEEGVKLADGTYIVQIENCLGKQTQVRGFCFIAEFVVVQSSNPAHPVGSKASYVQDFKIPQTAWSRLMHFVAALLQKNIKDPAQLAEVRSVCEGTMNAAVQGHYNGRYVQVQSVGKVSKEGRAYQRYNFQPYMG